MTTKIKDNSVKTRGNKIRKLPESRQCTLKKQKMPAGIAPTQEKKKACWLSRMMAVAVVIAVMIVVYIHVEGLAQAEPQNQSRMKLIYELYNISVGYEKKQSISDVLRARGVADKISQEIAETIVQESEKTDIPVEMYLAIMKQESDFRADARSSAYAKGIMQIQPGTWDAYVRKHNLPVDRNHIFLPQANIMVASVILKELYDHYARRGYSDTVIWNYVLAAYYAGPASVRDGIKGYHWRYIDKVKKYYSEFELQIAA